MFKILTYNIWGRFGPFEARFHNVLRCVQALEPDILCLQEATDSNLLSAIAERTGTRIAVSDTRETGLAVLTKFPFAKKKITPYLARSPFETYIRKFASVEVKLKSRSVLLVNTHLSWKEGDDATRSSQVRQLHAFVSGKHMPCVLAGDFNCEYLSAPMLTLRDSGYRDIMAGMPDEAKPSWDNVNPFIAGHKAKLPDRRIDLILADGSFLKVSRLLRASIVANRPGPDGLYASDHFGVLAEFTD